jgi:hypothetical protein
MDRGRVPRGTEINKVGLSKEPDSESLFTKEKAAPKATGAKKAARKTASRRAATSGNDNARSPKPRGGRSTKSTKRADAAAKRAEERAEQRIKDERADTLNIRGIQLKKSQGKKLTKQLVVTDASIIYEKDGEYSQGAVGEDADLVLSRGHTVWVLCDYGGKLEKALA